MNRFINSTSFLIEDKPPTIQKSTFLRESITPATVVPLGGYCNIPTEILQQIKRGESYYFGIEFYIPQEDDIFSNPQRAVFCMSDSRFKWQSRLYQDKIKAIPELTKFIGKTFNTLILEMANVERGSNSGSAFVFKNLIRGFRVGVRIIFPDLDDINMSRLIWWGRVAKVEDVNETSVKINCSQEIGDFSYELATQKYGQACPLWFGKGECLGTETFEQKSLLFRRAFELFGQGGCNRTSARCTELSNDRFYQGQNIVTVAGQFIRDEIVTKKILFFFTIHKHNRVPVQWSSKNQSDNDNVVIPIVIGRAKVALHAFTWADIGTQIIALMGASKGEIEGFYNITCHNQNLTIVDVTQHLGQFGGQGTQQPDGRFIQSGFNSRLAYAGITFGNSAPDDSPEDVPDTSAVIKGLLIPVRDNFQQFNRQWSCNPVWNVRNLLTNFPYTVVKPEWFNDEKLQETANYCFEVVEDDTDAESIVVSASDIMTFQNGEWTRFRSTGRFDSNTLQMQNASQGIGLNSIGQNELSALSPLVQDSFPDIWWTPSVGQGAIGQSRTYLTLRYTANGVINDKAKMSDLLFSLLLPTFRGYMRFNHFGKIEIDCRKPADNTFIRAQTPIASTEIPVASVGKFITTCGYLLIGVGLETSEIAKIKGIRYVNGSAQTQVFASGSNSLEVNVTSSFITREGAPAEIYMDFSGAVSAGEQVELKFTEPDGTVLVWDYFTDSADDSLATVALMFKTRLMASPSFRETWTAEIFSSNLSRVIIRCQTGYIALDRPLVNNHGMGEEVLRVVEVYEDGKDDTNPNGTRDNMKDFTFNINKQDTFHGVTGTYISAVQDFRETQIQPRVAWDAAEQERNLKLLELDLRFVDNYRQAAFLCKSATIEFVDGNLYAEHVTGIKGMFHEEGDVIAIRHQTMQGVSYTPFTVENLAFDESSKSTKLETKLYLSAAFDERVAKEEKFLEASLTTNPDPQFTPPPLLTAGGFSTTGTGDGGGGIRQNPQFETQKYETIPNQQVYSPEGRDRL